MVSKREKKFYDKILSAISKKKYVVDKTFSADKKIPPPENTREEFEKVYHIHTDRSFRIFVVEEIKNYWILLQIPDGKTGYDFNIWYLKWNNNEIGELKIPSYDLLGEWYNKLKEKSGEIKEYLINAIFKSIRDREPVETTVEFFFNKLSKELQIEIKQFLCTLKWVALQEDANYPPPKMGSKYPLAIYALLEAGFDLKEIRRIIRF